MSGCRERGHSRGKAESIIWERRLGANAPAHGESLRVLAHLQGKRSFDGPRIPGWQLGPAKNYCAYRQPQQLQQVQQVIDSFDICHIRDMNAMDIKDAGRMLCICCHTQPVPFIMHVCNFTFATNS